MAFFPSWSASASPSSYTCSPTCDRTWCSATTGRTFPAPTMIWSAAFAGSKRSIVVSVAARTGTRICCATGAVWPTRPGGSKIRLTSRTWSSAPLGLTVPAGESCDGRPPSLTASNSRAFVFVTSASPCSLPSKSTGPLLLSRHLCPDGFFLGWQACLEQDLLQRRQVGCGIFTETQLFAPCLAPKGELLPHTVPRLQINEGQSSW